MSTTLVATGVTAGLAHTVKVSAAGLKSHTETISARYADYANTVTLSPAEIRFTPTINKPEGFTVVKVYYALSKSQYTNTNQTDHWNSNDGSGAFDLNFNPALADASTVYLNWYVSYKDDDNGSRRTDVQHTPITVSNLGDTKLQISGTVEIQRTQYKITLNVTNDFPTGVVPTALLDDETGRFSIQ